LEEDGVVQTQRRFVGLDVHRRYATVAAVDSQQQVVLTARRIEFKDFDVWIRKHLAKTDVVTLEATSNAWHLYDKLVPLVASVTVANPMQIALIAKTLVKTDPRDALTLARLLAAGILPSVWVPPDEVRELRAPWRSSQPADQAVDSGAQSAAGSAVRAQPVCSGWRGIWTSQPRLVGEPGAATRPRCARRPSASATGR
jgi:Transposase